MNSIRYIYYSKGIKYNIKNLHFVFLLAFLMDLCDLDGGKENFLNPTLSHCRVAMHLFMVIGITFSFKDTKCGG